MKKLIIIFGILALIDCKSSDVKTPVEKKVDENKTESTETKKTEERTADLKKEGLEISDKELFEKIKDKYYEVGISSWYGKNFQGKKTASGEVFDRTKLTAAHKSLPFGSMVKVQNLDNNAETIVKINDRGPYREDRIIDVSEKAAEELKFKDSGTARVGLLLMKSIDKEDEDLFADDNIVLDKEIGDEDEDLKDIESLGMEEDKKSPKEDKKPAKKEDKKETKKESAKETKKEEKTEVKIGEKPKGYTIQLGVFLNKVNTDKYKKLESVYKHHVYVFKRNGKYVVQMGDFSNRQDAVKAEQKLKDNKVPCFVPKTKN